MCKPVRRVDCVLEMFDTTPEKSTANHVVFTTLSLLC